MLAAGRMVDRSGKTDEHGRGERDRGIVPGKSKALCTAKAAPSATANAPRSTGLEALIMTPGGRRSGACAEPTVPAAHRSIPARSQRLIFVAGQRLYRITAIHGANAKVCINKPLRRLRGRASWTGRPRHLANRPHFTAGRPHHTGTGPAAPSLDNKAAHRDHPELRASRATVGLACSDSSLRFTVTDDWAGLTPRARARHQPAGNGRPAGRARRRLDVRSQPGRGTSLTGQLPVSAPGH